MNLVYIIISHFAIVYALRTVEFIEVLKDKVGFSGRDIKPFDCAECLNFWIITLGSYFYLHIDPFISIGIGIIASSLTDSTQILIDCFKDLFINLYSKLNDIINRI